MTRILPTDDAHGFATRSVHAGQIIEPLAGAVMTPIYQTSTYVQQGLGKHRGYEYGRTQNPTREALERNVASLEGATHGAPGLDRPRTSPALRRGDRDLGIAAPIQATQRSAHRRAARCLALGSGRAVPPSTGEGRLTTPQGFGRGLICKCLLQRERFRDQRVHCSYKAWLEGRIRAERHVRPRTLQRAP